jgi:Uma2 family endonuclease
MVDAERQCYAREMQLVPPEVPRHRFTVDAFLQMLEGGVLGEGPHLELIDGEIVKVSPQGPVHIALKNALQQLLQRAYGGGCHVLNQDCVRLSERSLPEPDLAVVRGRPRDYLHRHATSADLHLLVEISVTSQRYDQAKAEVYSRALVPAYWQVDVECRKLVVHSGPRSDGNYRMVKTLSDVDSVTVPGTCAVLSVAHLLP